MTSRQHVGAGGTGGRAASGRGAGSRGNDERPLERLLTVGEVASLLGTSVRFPRRLIAERRIEYVKLGTHVRIPESAVRRLVGESTVRPVAVSWRDGLVA
jgi:excisionase family DNA binding protein